MNVLLAKVYDPLKHDPVGMWMSEKFDGVRALWIGTGFVSRTGKPFNAPDWFIQNLPPYQLDGELWIGRGMFQKTVSAVRKKVPVDSEWRNVQYKVFDVPGSLAVFEERMLYLTNESCRYGFQVVQQLICQSLDSLQEFYDEILAHGGEGVMLRQPGSRYVRRRSASLLKMKPTINGFAIITGIQLGAGKHTGKMGALHVQEIEPNEIVRPLRTDGIQFKVGTGFSDAQRKEEWKVGTIIKWEAGERTDSGKPRFPRFLARN